MTTILNYTNGNPTFSVAITSTELKVLSYVALKPEEWIENFIKERCRIASDEIVGIAVKACLEEKIQIPNSTEAIIELAFEKGWIKTAEERNSDQDIITE